MGLLRPPSPLGGGGYGYVPWMQRDSEFCLRKYKIRWELMAKNKKTKGLAGQGGQKAPALGRRCFADDPYDLIIPVEVGLLAKAMSI